MTDTENGSPADQRLFDLKPDFATRIPADDDCERAQCTHCGFVDYQNPKIVTGVVASWDNQILLCKRAIEPRKGFWTLPAGYMELGERVEDGAKREAWEEARADLTIDQILAVYSIPRISQVQILFRARLNTPNVSAGPESEAVTLYDWDDIPWTDLAFPTVAWALSHYKQTREDESFVPFSNPADGL